MWRPLAPLFVPRSPAIWCFQPCTRTALPPPSRASWTWALRTTCWPPASRPYSLNALSAVSVPTAPRRRLRIARCWIVCRPHSQGTLTPWWRRPCTVRPDARPAATLAFAVAPASLKSSSSTMPCALASRRERPTARSKWPDSATAWRHFIRTACAKSSAGKRALTRCCAWQGADMPRFRYRAFPSAGLVERGEIDCLTRADSLSVLSARGLVPFESAEAAGPPITGQRASPLSRSGRLQLKIYADLTRELSVLLAADIPLDA